MAKNRDDNLHNYPRCRRSGVFIQARLCDERSSGEIKTEIAIALPGDQDVDIKLTPKFTDIKRQIIYSLRDC